MGLAERNYYREKMSRGSSQHDGSYRTPPGKKNIPWAIIITIILVITGLVLTNSLLSTAPQNRQIKITNIDHNASPAKIPQLLPSSDSVLQEQPLPENGSCKIFYPPERSVARFTVNTDSANHYIVKLVDSSKSSILFLFIHANSSAEIKVPLGTYEVRWVCGNKWYGYEHLFGSSSTYRKALQPLIFQEVLTDKGKSIVGHYITFGSPINGNLPSSDISSSDF